MGVKVREKPTGSGEWWIFIQHHGKRKAKKIGKGHKGKRLAEDVAAKIEARLVLGDVGLLRATELSPTFEDYARRYLDLYATATLKPGTVEGYRFDFARHLKPAFGAKSLGEITRADVKGFVAAQVNRGLSPSSVRKHVSNLSAILGHAVEDGLLEDNPARGVKLPKKIDPKAQIHPLTAEELAHFLDTTRE
jgi:integrase